MLFSGASQRLAQRRGDPPRLLDLRVVAESASSVTGAPWAKLPQPAEDVGRGDRVEQPPGKDSGFGQLRIAPCQRSA